MLHQMKLYFKHAELLLEKNPEGVYVLQMGAKVLGTFSREKQALDAFNRVRRDMESKMPPTEITDAERRQLLDRYLADNLVQHNSLRNEIRKKPSKSRTFG
jgi:hypothetical protein